MEVYNVSETKADKEDPILSSRTKSLVSGRMKHSETQSFEGLSSLTNRNLEKNRVRHKMISKGVQKRRELQRPSTSASNYQPID